MSPRRRRFHMPHSPANPILIGKFDQSHRSPRIDTSRIRGPIAASRQVPDVRASTVPTVGCITCRARGIREVRGSRGPGVRRSAGPGGRAPGSPRKNDGDRESSHELTLSRSHDPAHKLTASAVPHSPNPHVQIDSATARSAALAA
jgi:hypothetical protein